MTVADRVKEWREKLGMSQEELAHKMGLKSRSSITRIEKSGDEISLKDVERLSNALGCSIPYLMGWKNIDSVPVIVDEETRKREEHFMRAYSRLDAYQQRIVNSMIDTLLSEQ